MIKHILITGASSGIGKACAERFAKEKNTHLILCGRRKERLVTLQQALESQYACQVTILAFDIQDKQDIQDNLQRLNVSHLDLLLNNAGLSLGKESALLSQMDDWERMVDTNIKGMMYMTKFCLPLLTKSNTPHIINIGSIAGINPYEGGNMYCASKAAVKSFSEALRIDLLPQKIKVTNIQPGAVETEFSEVRFKGDQQKAKKVYEGMTPLTGEDIADIIFYTATLPAHVCINELTVTPTHQANAYYTYRE